MIKKFRKKPVVIDAIQWNGNNTEDVVNFGKEDITLEPDVYFGDRLCIETLEGPMRASINDFIIKGVHGEFYACKPDIFEKTYELVDDTQS